MDGEIINADSMQVYQQMQILTARPSPDEVASIPHHLFGHISPVTRYSTGMWLKEVVPVILDCLARGKHPILVGGTGLYFKALTQGLAHIPKPTDQAMDETNIILAKGIDVLRADAERLDPVATARVLGADPQRLSRIVSVALGTEKSLSEWQKNTRPIIPNGFWYGAVMLPEREALYARIEERYSDMLEFGGLEEAKIMRAMELDPSLPAMKAIGLPPLIEFIEGKISYEEAVSRAQRDTRRFAKRQFTWFRGQAKHWYCVKNADDKVKFRQNISLFKV